MICEKCGKEIPENETVCPYCGEQEITETEEVLTDTVEVTEQVDLGDHTLFIGEVTEDVVLCDKPACAYDHYLKHIVPKK